jgi:hypothetical protein
MGTVIVNYEWNLISVNYRITHKPLIQCCSDFSSGVRYEFISTCMFKFNLVRNMYKILVGKPEGKSFGRLSYRGGNTITMDFRRIGWQGVEWSHLTQVRDQWQVLVNMVLNLVVP